VTQVADFWLAGQRARGATSLDVVSPADGVTVGAASVPTDEQVETAVAAAWAVRAELADLPAHVRADALAHVSTRLLERLAEVAALITAESGKPETHAETEVRRAASTFRWAGEETRRLNPAMMRLDTEPGSEARSAVVHRVPRGPVLGITPFNFPLNLVAHKVAPALAVGAPIVVKPAPATPLTALLLGDLLSETPLPAGSWSVLPVPNERMDPLVADPRLPVVSFTGSVPVGWSIRDRVPRKHVVLELGGNAAAYVAPDWRDPDDLAWAAQRIVAFAMGQAGQSCISVQRVYVPRDDLGAWTDLVGTAVDALDLAAAVGPVIDERAAARVCSWVDAAVAAGATCVRGGRRHAAFVSPTVLVDVPEDADVLRQEVFGPVLVLVPVDSEADAFARINDSRFGLQAGVFTHDLRVVDRATRVLQVGGIVVGDVPSYRADQMPYGGVKDSGTGREGVGSAMADLTEEKVVVLAVRR